MEVQLLGEGKLVIYLLKNDLQSLPAQPHEITTAHATGILRSALGSSYDERWESVCFEVYPGRDSLLLFAQQHSGNPYYFSFPDIELLIAASRACPPGLLSYLTYLDDDYILIVYPWNDDMPPHALWEFGTELILPALFSIHLSEHSRVLTGPSAIDKIRRTFK